MSSRPFVDEANARETDHACDRFEKAWRSGAQPHIEDFVATIPRPRRDALLRELVLLECALRKENGTQPDPVEYCQRFPGDQSLIRNVFDNLETVENAPPMERPGTVVGNYKRLQQIGEGGFGVVYMAEQTQPVRRKVALKVIKPGMDTKDVIARFEAERQTLALMDHPHIAKVFDAGTTEKGRPYFVMELVRGVPLTEFCDSNSLPMRDRLGLFVTICRAVQHAHQKGIIHRDLKPSNVMITLDDNKPMPKVIDFGVSKAIGQQLTEKTLYTAYGQMVGTPQYMSPEQAQMSAIDIDTRSDIYSLGVLLYEMLTGSTPLTAARLRGTAFAEMQRMIREEEPPKPSTRLSTLGKALAIIAQQRSTDAKALGRLVRGDLDWIAMQCLEKDRTRRYATANGLAMDVQRYLNNEPIEARPPSRAYRLRKLASRHRVALTTTAVVMFSLIAGIFSSTWLALQMKQAKEAAEQAREETQVAVDKVQATLTELQDALLERGFIHAFTGDLEEVKRIVEDAKLAGLGEDWHSTILGAAHLFRGDVNNAITMFETASADENNVTALALLAVTYGAALEWTEYERLYPLLQAAQPRTAYRDFDEFFLICALGGRDFAARRNRLEAILKRRPSWILPRVLIRDDAMIATQEFEDRAPMDAAFKESDSLSTLFPDNQFVTLHRLETVVKALEYARRHKVPSLKELQSSGFVAAEALANYRLADYWRAHFFDLVGDVQRAKDEWIHAAEEGSPLVAFDAAGFLYGAGYEEDAWSIIELRNKYTPTEKIGMAYMLADSPQGREKAIDLCESTIHESPTWWIRQLASKGFLLLGETERGRKECAAWIRSDTEADADNPWIWLDKTSIEFTAGGIDRDHFLQVGPKLLGRFMYHFTDGCLAVGEGDWDRARKQFKLCDENSSFLAPESNWARAFLRRLESDPEWPRAHRLNLEHSQTRPEPSDLSPEN